MKRRFIVRHVIRLRAIAAAGAASLLVVGGSVAAATMASAKVAPARATLAETHPAWATAHALASSTPVTTGTVTANVYLASPNASGLAAFARAVSSPGSKLYGHYLTPAQAQALYAPTAAQAQQVSNWATGAGLSVGKVVTGFGGYVQVSGSASAVAKAFSVTFGSYHMVKTKGTFRAPEQAASVPAAIAADVLTVTGLDSAAHLMKPAETLPPAPQNYNVAQYCSKYYGQLITAGATGTVFGTKTKIPTAFGTAQPWTNCGYIPAQIRGAYNVSASGETGKGVTVAVVDAYASPTMLTDANLYAEATGDKPFRAGQYSQVLQGGVNGWDLTGNGPGECGASGWYGEESLDVESVHGQAPNANVVYVGAVDCTDAGLLASLKYIVDNHAASIVTNSWGEPNDTSTAQPAYDQVFMAGAAEGIGFFFSSGDSGYEDPNYEDATDAVQVDFPTSSPWVTSVGGTSLAISRTNSYEFETSWGTIIDPLTVSKSGASSWAIPPADTNDQVLNGGWDGSGGGGVSTMYAQPWYQSFAVPAKLATTEVVSTPLSGAGAGLFTEAKTTVTTPMRVVPDVSALADASTGFLVGETLFGPGNKNLQFRLSRIGGTSLASPTFAGIEADAQQAFGHPIGFANPAIYALAGVDGITKAFHDVTGHAHVVQVRSNYTDPFNKTLPLNTFLRLLGVNGINANLQIPVSATATVPVTVQSALTATKGYDDATGVGSPDLYIQAFRSAFNW
jgi:subtilase family serine protease